MNWEICNNASRETPISPGMLVNSYIIANALNDPLRGETIMSFGVLAG
jgi:hypothetical protein